MSYGSSVPPPPSPPASYPASSFTLGITGFRECIAWFLAWLCAGLLAVLAALLAFEIACSVAFLLPLLISCILAYTFSWLRFSCASLLPSCIPFFMRYRLVRLRFVFLVGFQSVRQSVGTIGGVAAAAASDLSSDPGHQCVTPSTPSPSATPS